jgi:outer membrane protein assembly factor BamB
MKFRCTAPAFMLLVALAGCSSFMDTLSANKPKEPSKLVEFKPVATVQTRWHFDLGSGGSADRALHPAVTGTAVYAANARGEIFRLERSTGKEVWRAETGFAISAGVGAAEGLVLAGSEKGDVAAFDENGKLRWKVKVSSEVLSAPQAANGIVVVRTGDGRIAGLSTLDGSRQWLFERATPALVVRSHADVRIDHGVVYAGFAGGRMAAITLSNGVPLWEATVSVPRGNTELERISDITSTPVSDLDQVCAVSFQGNVACLDIAQGNPMWSRELSSDKGMAMSGKYVYVTDANGAMLAMDKDSGSSQWKNDQLALRRTSAPLVLDNYLAVGDYAGYLHLLNRDDGSFVARAPTDGSAIVAAPVELDGGVLMQTSGGGLYSLAIH